MPILLSPYPPSSNILMPFPNVYYPLISTYSSLNDFNNISILFIDIQEIRYNHLIVNRLGLVVYEYLLIHLHYLVSIYVLLWTINICYRNLVFLNTILVQRITSLEPNAIPCVIIYVFRNCLYSGLITTLITK